jgi:uncharacterized protein (TIGR00269 family)
LACNGLPVRTPRCLLCDEPAVYQDKKTGRHLCRNHFIKDVEQRVFATIRSREMIVSGDHVAVALSGGKDSTALLVILSRLLPLLGNVRLSAVTIDEGIRGYREETIRSAGEQVKKYGIGHILVPFAGLFGSSLDEMLRGREQEACSVCGILRRKALNVAAEKAGATKLATGHNLDDEAQSVFMNVLRGDLPRLVRDSGRDSQGRFIPRVKPLMYIPEKEIAVFLMLQGAWQELPECPYAVHALRGEVRTLLAALESRHPGAMLHLMESREKIESCYPEGRVKEPIRRCQRCGDSCSGEICQLCRLRDSLGR